VRLAGREAALWLAAESLTVEYAGEPLSRYEVKVDAQSGELRSVGRARLYETSHRRNWPEQRQHPPLGSHLVGRGSSTHNTATRSASAGFEGGG
jgi:hypothetical protein